jgi:hypothetical protein
MPGTTRGTGRYAAASVPLIDGYPPLMTKTVTGPDLEIPEASAFLRREWRVERIGWIAVLACMAAAAVGLLGTGPASRTTATAAGVEVEYARIVHHETEEELTVRFPVRTGPSTVQLRGDWAGASSITQVSPEPSDQVSIADGVRYVVPTAPEGYGHLTVAYRMDQVGVISGEVVVDGRAVPIRFIVLP